MKLERTHAAWNTPAFAETFKDELRRLGVHRLPLQGALSQSSHVADATPLEPVILNTGETDQALWIKAGIFYAGVVAGSCCADDPTPLNEQTEYCELTIHIDKTTAEADVRLAGEGAGP